MAWNRNLLRENSSEAKRKWATRTDRTCMLTLKFLTRSYRFSIISGDLLLLENGWYVTHAGLLRLARRRRCVGMQVEPVKEFSEPSAARWAFKATVYKSRECKGFVGYGDADPSNVSPLVRGAEMRVAETRAVNRALRKAYGIGICSVEEIGSFAAQRGPATESKKLAQATNGGNGNGNFGGRTVRDRLCQLIRQHQLDATLVKSYATDFCGVKTLRDATREQIENFVAHLASWAEKDRNAVLCQLNSYLRATEGAA
ncbi:MAG: hypothetical protein JWN45_2512 [Acidobacteriaceae bacterium]|nr:hypothetical protein [Acidobacteriaceae bacterium]